MKKFVLFLVIIVIILCGFSYIYITYQANYKIAKKQNMAFEEYLNQEVYGADLATVINKAVDNNVKNHVEKNDKGFYIDNNENSISISVKMLDDGKTYNMETFYQSGLENFIKYYNKIKFKCMNLQYHDKTHKVKYMLFEQITS